MDYKIIYIDLAKPFQKEAVQRTKKEDTKKGYDTTGIGYQYLVNRFNEVLGIDGWSFNWQVLETHEGTFRSGQPYFDITVEVAITIKELTPRRCTGGHIASMYADALKGAITNAFKKTAAFWGVGRQAYEGSLDDDAMYEDEIGKKHKPLLKEPQAKSSEPQDLPATDKQKRMVWAKLKKVYGSDDEAKKTCIIVTGKESSKDWTNADVQNILEQLDLDAMLEDKDEEKNSAPTVLSPQQEKDIILDMLRSLATEPEHVDAMCAEGIGKKSTDEWTAEDVDKMREYIGVFEKTKEAA